MCARRSPSSPRLPLRGGHPSRLSCLAKWHKPSRYWQCIKAASPSQLEAAFGLIPEADLLEAFPRQPKHDSDAQRTGAPSTPEDASDSEEAAADRGWRHRAYKPSASDREYEVDEDEPDRTRPREPPTQPRDWIPSDADETKSLLSAPPRAAVPQPSQPQADSELPADAPQHSSPDLRVKHASLWLKMCARSPLLAIDGGVSGPHADTAATDEDRLSQVLSMKKGVGAGERADVDDASLPTGAYCCNLGALRSNSAAKSDQPAPSDSDSPCYRLAHELLYLFDEHWLAYLEFCDRFDMRGSFILTADEYAAGFHLSGIDIDTFELEQLLTEAHMRFDVPTSEQMDEANNKGKEEKIKQKKQKQAGLATATQQQSGQESPVAAATSATASAVASSSISSQTRPPVKLDTLVSSTTPVPSVPLLNSHQRVFGGFLLYSFLLVRVFQHRLDSSADLRAGASGSSFVLSSFFAYLFNLCIFPFAMRTGLTLIRATSARQQVLTMPWKLLCFKRKDLLSTQHITRFQSRVLIQFRYMSALLHFEFLLQPGWFPFKTQWDQWQANRQQADEKVRTEEMQAQRRASVAATTSLSVRHLSVGVEAPVLSSSDHDVTIEMAAITGLTAAAPSPQSKKWTGPGTARMAEEATLASPSANTQHHTAEGASAAAPASSVSAGRTPALGARSFLIAFLVAQPFNLFWALCCLHPILFFSFGGFSTKSRMQSVALDRSLYANLTAAGLYAGPLPAEICLTNVEGFLPPVMLNLLCLSICAALSVPALRLSADWRRIIEQDALHNTRLTNARFYLPQHAQQATEEASKRKATKKEKQAAAESVLTTHASNRAGRPSLSGRGPSPSISGRVRVPPSRDDATSLGHPIQNAEALIMLMESTVNQRARAVDKERRVSLSRVALRQLCFLLISLAPMIVRACRHEPLVCSPLLHDRLPPSSASPELSLYDVPFPSRASLFLCVSHIILGWFAIKVCVSEMQAIARSLRTRAMRMQLFTQLLHPPLNMRRNRKGHESEQHSGGKLGTLEPQDTSTSEQDDETTALNPAEMASNSRSSSFSSHSPIEPQYADASLSAATSVSPSSSSLRLLVHRYLSHEGTVLFDVDSILSELTIRFRCFTPENCSAWFYIRTFVQTVRGHEVKRLELFLSLLLLLFLLSLASPLVVVLVLQDLHSLEVQVTLLTCGLLALTIGIFMMIVLTQAADINDMGASHATQIKAEQVAVMMQKAKAATRYEQEVRAFTAAARPRAPSSTAAAAGCTAAKARFDAETQSLDVSLALLEKMTASLEADPGAFRLLGLTIDNTLLNAIASAAAAQVIAIITILITTAKDSITKA